MMPGQFQFGEALIFVLTARCTPLESLEAFGTSSCDVPPCSKSTALGDILDSGVCTCFDVFSITDTYEYRAEPINTTTIPAPLSGEMSTLNKTVDMAIINTCLTFAAIHSVRGDVSLLACKELIFSVNEASPEPTTTKNGYILTKGSSSFSQREAMDATSPVKNEITMHCTNANGAMCPKRSTGCNLRLPVNISPLATTFKAANRIQQTV
mmetsp:Transcript_24840/g.68799  ORF Transcript_24840/g.68799 Transcript_24840/m.68799 type:complete len:210 (+) Transcript_24840:126-755(+)